MPTNEAEPTVFLEAGTGKMPKLLRDDCGDQFSVSFP
jgi:hypothetical protein